MTTTTSWRRLRRRVPVRALTATAVTAGLVLGMGGRGVAAPAATPPSADAAATSRAVSELSGVLGGLDAQPTLDTRLPGTGQAVSDVVSISALLNASLARTAASFTTGDLGDLVTALDSSDVPGLGVKAAATATSTGTRIVLTLGGSSTTAALYPVYADDSLVLDGTSASAGAIPVTGAVSGSIVLNLAPAASGSTGGPVVTLDPTSTLSVTMAGASTSLSVPGRYGFTDVTARGSAKYSVGVDLKLRDPDLTGGITRQEWSQARPEDLSTATVRKDSSAALSLDLDSNLVTGPSNGTLSSSLDAAGLVPTPQGDGTATFPKPALAVGTGLTDFAKVSGDDAVVAVGQVAAAYAAAQSRVDVPLPLVGANLSTLVSPAKPLTSFVESQGAAAVSCGRADTNPPGLVTSPGTTWYCQARTNDPVKAGSVRWTLTGPGSITANQASDATTGPSPTANVAVTGSVTEPEISVGFTSTANGKSADFTAQRRVRTAQELSARLGEIPGSSARATYDPTTRALSYAFATSGDPAAQQLPITIGDQLRKQARLRGVSTDDTLTLDVGTTRVAGTFGLLLGPAPAAADKTPVDRGYLQVDPARPELSVANIKTTAGSSFSGTGSVGYLGVGVQGTGLSITSTGLSADIDLEDPLPTADPGTSLPDAALLSSINGGPTTNAAARMTGQVQLSAAADVAVTSPLLPSGSYSSAVRQTLDLTTPTTDLPPQPTVTPNAAWATWVAPLDVQPEVSGRVSTADADGVTVTDSTAHFLSRDFGRAVTAGTVLSASVLNPRTGGTCSTVRVVSETTLSCVEQGPATSDGTATYVGSHLVGGKVATTSTPGTDDTKPSFDADNAWAQYDAYEIEGDPTAIKNTLLSGLYDVANSIQGSTDSSWRSALPLLGLVPKDLVPQTSGLRDLSATVRNLADEAMPAGCGTTCPDPSTLQKAPADLAALQAELEKRADALATKLDPSAGAADRVKLSVAAAVDGTPHVVATVELPAKGDTELPLNADLRSSGARYYLRRSAKDAGQAGAATAAWDSTLVVKIGVPISPTTSYRLVQVLPGTGVTKLNVKADTKAVDLTTALGPLEVRVGSGAGPRGDATEPTVPNAAQRAAGKVTVAGSATGTGTTLTDPKVDLGVLAGAATKAKRTSDGLVCSAPTAASSAPTSLTCDLPDATTDPKDRSWAAGDGYTLTSTSSTVLTDTTADFTTAGVVAGDVVVTSTTATDGTRTTTGVCTVASATKTQVVCAAPLTRSGSFASGTAAGAPTAYRILQDVLVDDGAGFDQLDLVGDTVTNTTDGSSCVVAAATTDTLSCTDPLTGGTVNRWEPGDEYAVATPSALKADLSYTFGSPADNAVVDTWAKGLTGTLTGTTQDCGPTVAGDSSTDVTGVACAVLPASTLPSTGSKFGTYLGEIGVGVTIDADKGAVTTATVSPGIKALDAGTTPLGLGILGDSVGDLGSSVQTLVDKSTSETDLPLLGGDAAAGSWLRPVLDQLGTELRSRLGTGKVAALPADAKVSDVYGDGSASLTDVVTQAANDAVDAMVDDQVDMADVLDNEDGTSGIAVTLTCDAGPCPADATVGDVQDVKLHLRVGKQATYQVPFDAGLPGLDVTSASLVDSDVDWSLDLDVGVSRDLGGYVDVAASKLALKAHAQMPDPKAGETCPGATVTGAFGGDSPFHDYDPDRCQVMTFGLLQATAYDGKGDDRTHADLDLSVGLDQVLPGEDEVSGAQLADQAAGGFGDKGIAVSGAGRENFYFVTGINPGVPGLTAGSLPSVHGTLDIGFNGDDAATGADLRDADADLWTIDYDNLYLDAGSFVNQFAAPVLGTAAKWVKPFKPTIDMVRAPIPGLAELADLTGMERPSILSIAKQAAQRKKGIDLSFIDKALGVLDVISSIAPTDHQLLIPLGPGKVPDYDPLVPIPEGLVGAFTVSAEDAEEDDCGAEKPKAANPRSSGALGVGAPGTTPGPAAASHRTSVPDKCDSTAPKGHSDNLFEREKVVQTGKCAPSGCTGKEATRTMAASIGRPSYTGTALTFPFLDDFSEIFGLLIGEDARLVHLDLGTLSIGAEASVKWNFLAGPVPVEIGLSFGAEASARLALGYDTFGLRNALTGDPGDFDPAALLDGFYVDDYVDDEEAPEIELVLTVKLEGSVSIRIFKAGVYGGVSLTIAADLEDPNDDGRLRVKEIASYADRPECLFSLSGTLEAFIGVFVEVDLWITTVRAEFEIYRTPKIPLFELKCEPQKPVLATVVGTDLRLNMGPNAPDRHLSVDQVDERFRVRQLTARTSGSPTTVSVEAFGETQTFDVPAGGAVTADGGSGNDTMDFLTGSGTDNQQHEFSVPVRANGGDGNDVITTGLGDDVVNGGAGNDRLALGDGRDTGDGGGDNDTIGAGFGDDTVTGGDGNDNISGDAGTDTLRGQGGDDTINGGPGLSNAQFVAIASRPGANPAVVDGDDLLVGGPGADRLSGHVGNDTLFGDEQVSGDFRGAACAADAGGGSATDGDVLDGEAGDDWLAGGGGPDTLSGSAGNDTLCGNAGDDTLNGDTVASGDPAGDDELRGGSGNDQLYGLAGSEYADGGPGDDLVDTGTGAAVAQGGTGSDSVVTAAGNDIVLGDTGTVAGLTFASGRPGVQSLGDLTASSGAALQARVSNADAAGTDGTLSVCTDRFNLLTDPSVGGGLAAGRVDLDNDGVITSGDTGSVGGIPVRGGYLDTDRDGSITDRDNGALNGVPVVAGRVDTSPGTTLRVVGTIRGASGTGDADCLLTYAGNDLVVGGAGGDRADAGDGVDLLLGGQGNDSMRGAAGTDELRGESGNDELLGDSGSDAIFGGTGDDTGYGGLDTDTLQGNEGNDRLVGEAGNDRLIGGSTVAGTPDGNDRLEGGAGTDIEAGDNATIGADGTFTLLDVERAASSARFPGASGNDTLLGDGDVDRLFGQGGNDTVDGGAADDRISGGGGNDTITGGEGSDEIVGGSGFADLPVDQAGLLDGDDTISGGGSGSSILDRTDVILGDNGTMTRPGTIDPNTGVPTRTVTLYDLDVAGDAVTPAAGVAGNDTIDGGGNRDQVYGQGGADTLSGGIGDDWLEGNAGSDTISGDAGDDDTIGGSSSDVRTISGITGLVGKPGAGTFPSAPDKLTDGADAVAGGDGNDAVLGDNGCVLRPTSFTAGSNSVLSNGCDTTVKWSYQRYQGADLLGRAVKVASAAEPAGAFGNDVLRGGSGHDEVYGGLGDDVAEGGAGDDSVVGDLARVVTTVNTAAAKKLSVSGFMEETVGGPGTLRHETLLYPDPGTPVGTRTGGNDTLLGGLGGDSIHGGAGNDTVWGNRSLVGTTPTAEATAPAAGADRDAIFGDHGDDVLWGGWDRDHLFGGHGNDRIDLVTNRNGADPRSDFKGADLMYGGWGADAMQADVSNPAGGRTETSVDKMVDTVGSYNGFYTCDSSYASSSVSKNLDSTTAQFWQGLALGDGAAAAGTTNSSGWWEVGLVASADARFNSSPAYSLGTETPVCR